MEIRQTITALNLFDAQLDFLRGLVFIVVQIGEVDLQNAALQFLTGNFRTVVFVTNVLPQLRTEKTLGALMSYHSFFKKTSPAFFLLPFLPPLVNRLFFPTAIATLKQTVLFRIETGTPC